MKLKTGITMGLAFLAALIFTTSAYANGSTQKFRTVDQIKKSGTLVMYTDAGWPPYEYIGENGQPDGIDIDISKRVAKDLGVKLQITNAAFDGFPIALMNGQADMAASAITINAERKETLDFSIPYTVSVQSIIVKDSDTTTKCLNDLKGKKTGVYLGTTGDFLVSDAIQKGVLKGTGATVLQYKSLQDAMLAMMKGDLDAVVCDDTYAQNLVTMNPGTHYVEAKLADGTITKEEYGVAVDKGNKTLVDAINATIQAMKDDGSMAKCIKDQIMKSTLKN